MNRTKRLDDCLTIRDGRLYLEESDTVALTRTFGSPIFALSENQLRRNARSFQRSFQAGWPGPVKVLPAAKANWAAAVQRIMASEGCGCDVYSPVEMSIALAAGCDPQYISVNGVPKDEAQICAAVRSGCRITIDSLEEVDVIERAAHELGQIARVRLRIKPVLADYVRHTQFAAEGLVPTDLAALIYKGGLTYEQIMTIAPRLLRTPHIKLVGFHQHNGRHDRSLSYWRAQMQAFAAEVGRICRSLDGYRPQELDIGGGFATPRDPFNAATDYTEPLQYALLHLLSKGLKLLGRKTRYGVLRPIVGAITKYPNQTRAPSVAAYGEVVTGTLRHELELQGINPQQILLELEPGRAMFGDTGIHLTTVRAIKRIVQPIPWNVLVVDTTEFWFTGGRYEHHMHDYVWANKAAHPYTGKADVIGRSCYGDRLLGTVPVPDVKVGDVLALLDTGAYQEVSMSNFNALPRPATVLVNGDRAEVIRRAETEEDVLCRDVVPERLRGKMVSSLD